MVVSSLLLNYLRMRFRNTDSLNGWQFIFTPGALHVQATSAPIANICDLQPCNDLADEIRPVKGRHKVVRVRNVRKLPGEFQ